jgi:hypothetical protein
MTHYQWLAYADDDLRPAHAFVHGDPRAMCRRAKRPVTPVDNLAVRQCLVCRNAIEHALDFVEAPAP